MVYNRAFVFMGLLDIFLGSGSSHKVKTKAYYDREIWILKKDIERYQSSIKYIRAQKGKRDTARVDAANISNYTAQIERLKNAIAQLKAEKAKAPKD